LIASTLNQFFRRGSSASGAKPHAGATRFDRVTRDDEFRGDARNEQRRNRSLFACEATTSSLKVAPLPMSQPPPAESAPADASDDDARPILRWFVATAALICGLVLALNVTVNPLGYFPSRWFRPLTWNTRVAKSEEMTRTEPCSAIVLGSSRSMLIRPESITSITGLPAYNAAVDSAKAEDWLAITKFALDDLRWPLRIIVLGVDVEAFHDRAPPDGRLGGAPRLLRHVPLSYQMTMAGENLASGLSLDQFTSSLRSLWFRATSYPEDASQLTARGGLRYVKWDRAIAAHTFVPDIAGMVESYDGRFAGMSRVGAERAESFRALLRLAEQRHIRVYAFITPLHDAVVARLRARRDFARLLQETTQLLDAEKREHPATLSFVDYTDVRTFGGDPELFYDGAHVRTETAERLTRTLLRADFPHAVQ
jgi:hypothetical protein